MAATHAGPPLTLVRHLDVIEGALRAAIADDPAALPAALRYVMGWTDEDGRPTAAGGKRLRPALCLFGAEAVGGGAEDALPGAVAVELVHNFSLVHDEIQDQDAERHGRPTLWARLGGPQAINAGDLLYSRAIRALTDAPGPAGPRMAALAVLNLAIERMIEGQWLDMSFETRESVTVDEYVAMSAGKTGALLGAPLEMGALLAGGDPEVARGFGAWGVQVGLAFQAQDDYLGIWGDPDDTGKSNTNDIVRKKKSLPIIHGLLSPDHAPVIRRTYAAEVISEGDVGAVVKALTQAGADELCRAEARRHADEADALLDGLALGASTRAAFQAIAAYMVDRNF